MSEPFAHAYGYPDGIRFETGGREINGSRPTSVLALFTQVQMEALIAAALEHAAQSIDDIWAKNIIRKLVPADAQKALAGVRDEVWRKAQLVIDGFKEAKKNEVAAAVALVVQKAAEVCDKYNEYPNRSLAAEAIKNEVLALANPNALAEHDAALREQACVEQRGRDMDILREIEHHNHDLAHTIIEKGEQVAKLEAENAGLRHQLERIKDGHSSILVDCHCICAGDPDCCEKVGEYCPHCIAQCALLGEKT